MPKVVLEPCDGNASGYRLSVDGVDLSEVVAADGVRIAWENGFPCVKLTLRPAELWADLPDAVVSAAQALS